MSVSNMKRCTAGSEHRKYTGIIYNEKEEGAMDLLKDKCSTAKNYMLVFLKWILAGLLIGAAVGLWGIGFAYGMSFVNELRETYSWLLFCLPVAGLIIVWLYHVAEEQKNKGTNLILLAVRSEENIPFRVAPLMFVSTLLTHLCGGSAGREGAALQMGGSLAQQLGRCLKVDERTMKIFTMCGMSACFSALFGTPAAATIFSLEVVNVGIMQYSALVPCAVAALTADVAARYFKVGHMQFVCEELMSSVDLLTAGKVCLLAAAAAAVSILFCETLHKTGALYKRWIKNPYLRAAVGALLIIALTLVLGTRDYLSVGEHVIEEAVGGHARPEAFLLKIIFTAITLEAGFKGGEIVPSLFIGSTFGCVAAGILGLNPAFGAALGMAALFCGVTNCPIASVLMGLELFGGAGIEWFLLAVAVSYVVSGYFSLYSSQKIMYAKENPEYIEKKMGHA